MDSSNIAMESRIGSDRVYTHVGQELRRLRIGKGLTQAATALVVGVSPQQYQKYEDGSSKCSLSYLMELAAFFGVSLSDLLPKDATLTAEINEADMLARLVAAYSAFGSKSDKLWIVEHVEAILDMRRKGAASE